MNGRGISYFRAMRMQTIQALSEQTGIPADRIRLIESGVCQPGEEGLDKLENALDISYGDLARYQEYPLTFQPGPRQKPLNLSPLQQEYIRECVREYFARFMTVLEFFPEEVLPPAPSLYSIELSSDSEQNACSLRDFLGLPRFGPVDNLTAKLEEKGFLICECGLDSNRFSGMNGLVNGRPYILLNANLSPERSRAALAHELAHLMFAWPADLDNKAVEHKASAVSEAFLFPGSDVLRTLSGLHGRITSDILPIAAEYGISAVTLVRRAEFCGAVSEEAARRFDIIAAGMGWRRMEPGRIAHEHPTLFESLVYRAVNEQEISAQRGVELLRRGFNDEMAKQLLDRGW